MSTANATSERRKDASRSRSPSLSEEFNSEFKSTRHKSRSPKTLWFPTEEMNSRHQNLLKDTIPAMD